MVVTLKIMQFLNHMCRLLNDCILLRLICMSRNSSVGTVRKVGLDCRRKLVQFQAGLKRDRGPVLPPIQWMCWTVLERQSARTWNWRLTFMHCRGYESTDLSLHSPLCLNVTVYIYIYIYICYILISPTNSSPYPGLTVSLTLALVVSSQ